MDYQYGSWLTGKQAFCERVRHDFLSTLFSLLLIYTKIFSDKLFQNMVPRAEKKLKLGRYRKISKKKKTGPGVQLRISYQSRLYLFLYNNPKFWISALEIWSRRIKWGISSTETKETVGGEGGDTGDDEGGGGSNKGIISADLFLPDFFLGWVGWRPVPCSCYI